MELGQRIVEAARWSGARATTIADSQSAPKSRWQAARPPLLDRAVSIARRIPCSIIWSEPIRACGSSPSPAQRARQAGRFAARPAPGRLDEGAAPPRRPPRVLAALVGADDRLGEPLLLAGEDRRDRSACRRVW